MKQRKKAKQYIFASLMDLCHPKNAKLEPKFQKYKGRVVLRGGMVKDDSYAIFTEQCSSASQMTAAKVMDIISRLPGCTRQAADAISVYPSQNGRCTDVTASSKIGMSRYWNTFTKTRMAEIMVQHGRPSRSSSRTFMGKARRESSIGTRLGKSSKLGMLIL